MKRAIYLTALCVFFSTTLFAQGSIHGTVMFKSKDANRQERTEPLVGATVFVTWGGERVFTRTNNHGDYIIRPLEPGAYNITIASPLIDTIVVPGIHVSGSQTTFVPLVTAEEGVLLGVVQILPPKTTLASESPSKMQLRQGELEKFADSRNLNQVIGVFGGAYVSDNGRQISFRGARIGDALYIVDGVRQRSTDVTIPGRAIGSITAYNGGIPAQYGDMMGGVVVIETMSYFDWENQQEVKRLIAQREAEQERVRIMMEERQRALEQQANPELEQDEMPEEEQ